MAASRSRTPRAAFVILLVTLLSFPLTLPALADSVEERRLREARQQLEHVRERIAGAAAERDGHAQRLAEAEQHVAAVLQAVNQAELAVQRQQEAVEAARRRLGALEQGARSHRRVMADRAVELYRQGTTASWSALLAADGPDEALARSSYVEIVSRADREMFERVEIDQVKVEAQRATLEAEEATLQRVLAQRREIHAEAEALRDERAVQLAGAHERLAALHGQEAHLEAESRELAALMRRAAQVRQASSRSTAAAPAAASGAVSSGGWTWPARGGVTSGFGMRWGRRHEGLDIGAGHGAPVVAARSGQVTYAGRMGGYGNLVLVSHGSAVTAYAHLSSFAVSAGDHVGAGQRIGSVGCTGSCTGPHLHFEIRVNGAARNPLGYLP